MNLIRDMFGDDIFKTQPHLPGASELMPLLVQTLIFQLIVD